MGVEQSFRMGVIDYMSNTRYLGFLPPSEGEHDVQFMFCKAKFGVGFKITVFDSKHETLEVDPWLQGCFVRIADQELKKINGGVGVYLFSGKCVFSYLEKYVKEEFVEKYNDSSNDGQGLLKIGALKKLTGCSSSKKMLLRHDLETLNLSLIQVGMGGLGSINQVTLAGWSGDVTCVLGGIA